MLVVTTPEPTAITDAYAVIKVISRDGTDRRISLLVNQVRSEAEAQVVHDRIAKVARQFLGVHVLDAGYVVADEQVSAAVRRRTPFVLGSPRCPASHAWPNWPCAWSRASSAPRRRQGGGFFNRMGRWFADKVEPEVECIAETASNVERIAASMALVVFAVCLLMGIEAENTFATTVVAGAGSDGRHAGRRAGRRRDGAEDAGREYGATAEKNRKFTRRNRPPKTDNGKWRCRVDRAVALERRRSLTS